MPQRETTVPFAGSRRFLQFLIATIHNLVIERSIDLNMAGTVRVAVTGAAGQIGYALLPRLASGEIFGADTKVALHLLEITPALPALDGVVMELDDCAFPLLADVVATDRAEVAFDGDQPGPCLSARNRAARGWNGGTS